MSRLTDLIAQTKAIDPAIGTDLEREFRVLSSRLPFGLNFERHRPEAVELPQRPVRKGETVRILPPRDSIQKGDQRLWQVRTIDRSRKSAELVLLGAAEGEKRTVELAELVVVAEFRDTIYPGLVSTGSVQRGGGKPFHTVINGENYHVLKALTYTHSGAVDVIYIDPPYNSGARDWKYNNDYVESDDLYRHSKWLAMMERRLLVARTLLNPRESVLIITIDEKEYLRLGLLLEQMFPDANIQMVSSVINPKGTARTTYFSRTDEFIFFVFFGTAKVPNHTVDGEAGEIRWRYLRRTDIESARGTKKGGPAQFYPIYVDNSSNRIVRIGDPLPHGVPRETAPALDGCTAVFPIREDDGMEMNWGLTAPSLQKALEAGYVRVSKSRSSVLQPYVFSYVTAPNIKRIKSGKLIPAGRRPDGSWIIVDPKGKSGRPTTTWREGSHEAGAFGTSLLRALLPGRKFPFPKSLYAVEDTLRFFINDKPNATVLDFFAGSGTTAHAVMRLNRQDGGSRKSISVTNNEVGADEHKALRAKGLRPGDLDWEAHGICESITKPRVAAAVSGVTPNGQPIKGEYKFTDPFPMNVGLTENAEFFTLTYELPVAVSHNMAFSRIAPLLWLRAGATGRRINEVPADGWEVADTYGILVDIDAASAFIKALKKSRSVRLAYIVTDDDRRFQAIARRMQEDVDSVRLYESYLTNFSFANGD